MLDETAKRGFTIQKLGKPATNVTSTRFLGRHTVTLTLNGRAVVLLLAGEKKTDFIVAAPLSVGEGAAQRAARSERGAGVG